MEIISHLYNLSRNVVLVMLQLEEVRRSICTFEISKCARAGLSYRLYTPSIYTTCSLRYRYAYCFQLSTDGMARKSQPKEHVILHTMVFAHNLTQTQLTLLTYQSLRTMVHAII
jgi:hypothetical protein